MSDISVEELSAAIERVLPEGNDMSQKEMLDYLLEHEESFRESLVEVGAVEKGEPGASDILHGFYSGGDSQTTTVSRRMAKRIERQFAPPDVEARSPDESPSLGVFYGGEVDTPAGSTQGDTYHNSG